MKKNVTNLTFGFYDLSDFEFTTAIINKLKVKSWIKKAWNSKIDCKCALGFLETSFQLTQHINWDERKTQHTEILTSFVSKQTYKTHICLYLINSNEMLQIIEDEWLSNEEMFESLMT